MNAGKIFEKNVKDSVDEEKIYFYRLRDSPSSFNINDKNKNNKNPVRFSPSNDYDFILFQDGHFFAIELKSTQSTSISIGSNIDDKTTWKGKSIKFNQVKGLLKANKHNLIHAGFLLNFRQFDKTFWLDISEFEKFCRSTSKVSINMADVVRHGGILVDQTLKKVNYRYDIQKMINDVILSDI